MATTSTSDSARWTSRRVRERWVVAGGAWLTIAIIPSNDPFQHTTGPDGSVNTGQVDQVNWSATERVTENGQDTQTMSRHGRSRHPRCPVRSHGVAEPFRQWGTRSPARTA